MAAPSIAPISVALEGFSGNGKVATPALLSGMLRAAEKISDLIFSPGRPPQVQVYGQMIPVQVPGFTVLTPDDTRHIAADLIGDNKTAITMISAAADQPLRRVLIASAQHGEGRTCVALNLACALAQAKQRVLVVDTDLQRPSLLRLLGIEADTDIAEAVTHQLSASAATISVMPYGFHVLPLRERVENSAEILASPALREMLNDCEADYDFMIFD